ncbi:uroporphyrinogen-III C-methyltransferase, partial [Escherichia coli]|nr:uroporphyrinogen-III C-methyltransferase [Escherichia coli]
DEVDQLSQQNISMDLPETLQSQAMLEKLMQTRVRNLLAQPAAGTTEAKPAPQGDTPAAAPQGE